MGSDTMNLYQRLIAKATGLTDIDKIRMVEQYMRQIYFHSTLGWQTQSELYRAARASAIELEASGWNFK